MAIGIVGEATGDETDGPSSTLRVYLIDQRQSCSTMSTFGVVFIRIGDSLEDDLTSIFSTSNDVRTQGVRGWDVFGLDSNHIMGYYLMLPPKVPDGTPTGNEIKSQGIYTCQLSPIIA